MHMCDSLAVPHPSQRGRVWTNAYTRVFFFPEILGNMNMPILWPQYMRESQPPPPGHMALYCELVLLSGRLCG